MAPITSYENIVEDEIAGLHFPKDPRLEIPSCDNIFAARYFYLNNFAIHLRSKSIAPLRKIQSRRMMNGKRGYAN